MSATRLNRGDIGAAAAALVLLATMFAFAWYGVDGIPGGSSVGSAVVSAEDAWNGLTVIRWLMLLTIVAALGSCAIHIWPMSRSVVAAARLTVLTLGGLSFVLVAYRVLIALPSADRVVDQKLGAFLGVICALAIALGGYEAVREQRARLLDLRARPRARNALASGRDSE